MDELNGLTTFFADFLKYTSIIKRSIHSKSSIHKFLITKFVISPFASKI